MCIRDRFLRKQFSTGFPGWAGFIPLNLPFALRDLAKVLFLKTRFLAPKSFSNNVALIQEFDRRGVTAVLPLAREEPDAALTDAEVGRGEGQTGIDRWLGKLRVIFGAPAEQFAGPGLVGGVQCVGEAAHLIKVGTHNKGVLYPRNRVFS